MRGNVQNIVNLLPIFFLGFFGIYGLISTFPIEVFYYYIVISTVSFTTYGLDKHAAKEEKWRISEASLNLISFLGGWPGSIWAQHYYRHKIRKRSFLIKFWGMAIINCLGALWVITPEGTQFLYTVTKLDI